MLTQWLAEGGLVTCKAKALPLQGILKVGGEEEEGDGSVVDMQEATPEGIVYNQIYSVIDFRELPKSRCVDGCACVHVHAYVEGCACDCMCAHERLCVLVIWRAGSSAGVSSASTTSQESAAFCCRHLTWLGIQAFCFCMTSSMACSHAHIKSMVMSRHIKLMCMDV